MLLREPQRQPLAQIEILLVGNGEILRWLVDVLRQRLLVVAQIAVPVGLAGFQAQVGLVLGRPSEADEVERVANLVVAHGFVVHGARTLGAVWFK